MSNPLRIPTSAIREYKYEPYDTGLFTFGVAAYSHYLSLMIQAAKGGSLLKDLFSRHVWAGTVGATTYAFTRATVCNARQQDGFIPSFLAGFAGFGTMLTVKGFKANKVLVLSTFGGLATGIVQYSQFTPFEIPDANYIHQDKQFTNASELRTHDIVSRRPLSLTKEQLGSLAT